MSLEWDAYQIKARDEVDKILEYLATLGENDLYEIKELTLNLMLFNKNFIENYKECEITNE